MPTSNPCRDDLVNWFECGVSAVRGDTAVRRFLSARELQGELYPIAIGKAASAMLRGALDVCESQTVRSLLITKHGHVEPAISGHSAPVECLESSHPVPGEDSLLAGHRLLKFIASTPTNAHLLFLLSGGASSLVECLPGGHP